MGHARTRMVVTSLAKGISNGIPEGGVHLHPLTRESGVFSTGITGRHIHLFLLPNGMLVASEFDGAHIHTGETSEWHEYVSGGWHDHTVYIGGQEFKTESEGYHDHVTQSDGVLMSGAHDHFLRVGEEYVWSLTPQQTALITGLGDATPETVKDVIAAMGKMAHGKDKDKVKKSDANRGTDAVLVRRSYGEELRTSAWTLKLDGEVRMTRGWADGGQPIRAGHVSIVRSSDDEVELWLEDNGNRPERSGESIIVRRSEDDTYTVVRDETPAAFRGDADLPEVVKAAVPVAAQFWKLDEARAAGAREWLVETSWWSNRAGLAKAGEDHEANVTEFVTELVADTPRCQSPMAADGKIAKDAGRIILHDCMDEDLVKESIESGDYIVMATAGTPAAELLERTATKLGKEFGFSPDPRVAATVVATSCNTPVVPTTKVAKAAASETACVREALEKAATAETDFGPILAPQVPALLKSDAWSAADIGLAARAVFVAKMLQVESTGSAENLNPETGSMTPKPVVSTRASENSSVAKNTEEPAPEPAPEASGDGDAQTYELTLKSAGEEDDEERIVFGIVMEPDATDTQGDFQREEVIRRAAHWYMENHQNVGLQHKLMLGDGARVLESYIARSDTEINGVAIRKGTWLMAVRILDDETWAGVKSGTITGFSIGGRGHREPIAA